MVFFTDYFNLGKSQGEIDFVNVPIDGDIPLFIDPFALSQRLDPISSVCHDTLVDYFSILLDSIRFGNDQIATRMLSFLREPNETRFGYSSNKPKGAGIGKGQSKDIFQALKDSSAVKTGFISSLEECELMVEGIARDKISDLTTNIIRAHLAEYTKNQCDLWSISTRRVPLPPAYNMERHEWISSYFELPVANNSPILLVPKAFARYDPAYDHGNYYRHFVLDFLQSEHLDANSSLVNTLKNGKRVVYKKDIEEIFPCTKENLFKFSQAHPDVLLEYRTRLEEIEKRGLDTFLTPDDESIIANSLIEALTSIRPGNTSASEYHSLMIGIIEFIFFPNLLNPVKEQEIHQGRKRIDIMMENGARTGIFYRLHDIRNLPCPYVSIECKNYNSDVNNPELDQLSSRFSPLRGKLGFLCCRSIDNRELFVERCRDTFKDDRGLIIPLDDKIVIELLSLIALNKRQSIEQAITELVNEIWVS